MVAQKVPRRVLRKKENWIKPSGRSFARFSYRLPLHEASTFMAIPPIVRRMLLPRSTALTPLDGSVNLLTRMLQWGFGDCYTYCLDISCWNRYIVNQSMAAHSVIDNRTNRTRMFWSAGWNELLSMSTKFLTWLRPAEWRINLRAYNNDRVSPCFAVELSPPCNKGHSHEIISCHNLYRAIGESTFFLTFWKLEWSDCFYTRFHSCTCA